MTRMTMQARTMTIAMAALAVTTMLAGCRDGGSDASAEPTTPTVTVGRENIALVREEQVETGPTISGSLQAEREATVRAQVSGPVVATYAEQGQRVSAGTLLAKLDDAAFRDAYLSARSGVTSAQTAASNAQREMDRAEKLVEAGAIAERDVEQARSANQQAQSLLADAKARLTNAEETLKRTEIRAPFDGVVSTRSVSAGDVVQPGGALYTVVDPSSMRLEASVPAEQLGAVKLGAPVSFAVNGYPEKSFSGRVTRINPTADPVTRQVTLLVSIPNAGNRLVAGLFAEGRVASETHTGLVVPASAVDERGVRPAVTRIKDGRVQRVDVQIGLRDAASETIEVIGGLAPNDTILLGAAQSLEVNTPIRVQVPSDRAQR